MKTIMDKITIIKLKELGKSNREVAKELNIDRKTVAKYWNEYLGLNHQLNNITTEIEKKIIQEKIVSAPKYNINSRMRRKLTDDFFKRLMEILDDEKEKNRKLGPNKQGLTKKQIYEILKEEGFNVGLSTVTFEIRKIKSHEREIFIKQNYEYGDRLEYDFGEVKVLINNELKKYYMAVLSSPK